VQLEEVLAGFERRRILTHEVLNEARRVRIFGENSYAPDFREAHLATKVVHRERAPKSDGNLVRLAVPHD
jgi:hypothetical protein